jgi:membrane protein required for colicin V production
MTPALNDLDLALLAIVFVSILFGVIRGLVREVLSLAFLVLGLVLAFLFYPQAGALLRNLVHPPALAVVVGFFVILALVLIVGALFTWLIRHLLVRGPLRALDRVLGGLFGLLRGCLVGAVLVFAMLVAQRNLPHGGPLPQAPTLVRESALAPHLLAALRWLSGVQAIDKTPLVRIQP